jgi:hypothetical protein
VTQAQWSMAGGAGKNSRNFMGFRFSVAASPHGDWRDSRD